MVFHNRVAGVLWAFAAAWVIMLLLMAHVLIHDGWPSDLPWVYGGTAVVVFWLAGLGLVRYAASRPCTTVQVPSNGPIEVVAYYPHRRIRQRYSPQEMGPARVVETQDIDGDPYYLCQLAVGYPFQQPIRMAEGSREHCESVCQAFNGAIGQGR